MIYQAEQTKGECVRLCPPPPSPHSLLTVNDYENLYPIPEPIPNHATAG